VRGRCAMSRLVRVLTAVAGGGTQPGTVCVSDTSRRLWGPKTENEQTSRCFTSECICSRSSMRARSPSMLQLPVSCSIEPLHPTSSPAKEKRCIPLIVALQMIVF